MGQAAQVPGLPVRALAMLLPGVPEPGRKVARQCPLFSHSLAQQAIYMHCVKVPDSPPVQARGRGSDSFYSSFPPAIPLILVPRSPLLSAVEPLSSFPSEPAEGTGSSWPCGQPEAAQSVAGGQLHSGNRPEASKGPDLSGREEGLGLSGWHGRARL